MLGLWLQTFCQANILLWSHHILQLVVVYKLRLAIPAIFYLFSKINTSVKQIYVNFYYSVFSAGIRTHDLLIISLLTLPLEGYFCCLCL